METCPNPTRELILEFRKLTGSPCPLQCCFLSQLRTLFLRLAHLCISLNSWVGTLFNYSVYVGFYGALGGGVKSARRFHAKASSEQRVSGRKWHFKPCVWLMESKMETTIVCRGYMRIMEENMETSIMGYLGFRDV